jgi:DNA-binding NarL/FixJ family response regulator
VALASGARVLIADDHAPTRSVVRNALEQSGFVVVADVASGPAAVAEARSGRPDLALLDIRMPGGGIAAAWSISALDPAPAVVMLTVSEDEEDLFAALRAGAAGYILKGIDALELPSRLEAVLAGEATLPGPLVSKLISEFRRRERRRLFVSSTEPSRRLTRREWEVLELMDLGLSTAQIATRLFVSTVTVRSHAAMIVKKLRVENRSAAVELLRSGLIPDWAEGVD